jgi:basic amino acid/polyamine antiporter, APA family
MTATAATPEVFTRKASGLVRVMSPYSAFIYNILTMGPIFPWVFLISPAAFPGGNIVLGILICTAIQIPIAYSSVWLSTAMPRSGGDYVFQSRVFGGGIGFTIVMSGLVVWTLVWTALSGWLVAVLGLAPLFLGLGRVMSIPAFIAFGVWCTTPVGLFILSTINAALAVVLLVAGFSKYVRFQNVIWIGTLIGLAATLWVLFTTSASQFPTLLNAFSASVGDSPSFYQNALAAAQAAGVNTNPSFSWLFTLLIAPVAWQSLQWSTYSAEQNGEIKDARSFKNQSFVMIGSLIATGLLLALLGLGLQNAAGTEGQVVASYGFWYIVGSAKILGSIILAPSMIAIAMTANPLLILLIGVGFTLNAFQIICNCYIGMTRIMVAMSLDRTLPEWVSQVHETLHTPVNAHIVYFLLSLPIFWFYNFYADFGLLTLGVTFGCGYAFAGTAIAGALFPFRAKELYESSPGSKYKVNGLLGLLMMVIGVVSFVWATWVMADTFVTDPLNYPVLAWLVRLVSIGGVLGLVYLFRAELPRWASGGEMPLLTGVGVLGAGFGMAMVMAFLLRAEYAVLGNWAGLTTLLSGNIGQGIYELRTQVVSLVVIILVIVGYFVNKAMQQSRGVKVEYAFKEIPPE